MKQYIDKDALVAEIEKRECLLDLDNPLGRGGMVELEFLKNTIDTLEVKEFKDEPKFKVGDIIKHNRANIIRKVVSVNRTTGSYCLECIKTGSRIELFYAEQNFHLWTIEDANEGDVLCIHSPESDFDCVFLYQNTVEIESGRNVAVAYCGIDVYVNKIEFGVQGPDCIDVRKIKPATKEQCDLLFSKMKDVGYEWDAEKKELRKIEQKSTWSEEDSVKLNDVVRIVENSGNVKSIIEHYTNWLKSLKERVQIQPKQEWSEDITNEYIDIGLPSGTLWKSTNEEGYYTYDGAVEKFSNQLPTKEQWEELKNECKWKWKGNGYDVIGPNGNTIYLPAMGYHNNRYTCIDGIHDGYYWSRTDGNVRKSYGMYFDGNYISVDYNVRYYGRSVRLVK